MSANPRLDAWHCYRLTEAAELLRSYALARGWVAAGGLPDETRSGRQILKDFVNGKLLHCERPPGCSLSNAELGLQGQAMSSVPARQAATHAASAVLNTSSDEAQPHSASSEDDAAQSASDGAQSVKPPDSDAEQEQEAGSVDRRAAEAPLSAADRDLVQSLSVDGTCMDVVGCSTDYYNSVHVLCQLKQMAEMDLLGESIHAVVFANAAWC